MAQQHLLLTGYRGCGKSGVGKLLSELLRRDFIDTDIEIEINAGKTIAELFTEVGEEGFRDLCRLIGYDVQTGKRWKIAELGSRFLFWGVQASGELFFLQMNTFFSRKRAENQPRAPLIFNND